MLHWVKDLLSVEILWTWLLEILILFNKNFLHNLIFEYLELEFNPSGTTASYQVGAVTYGNFKTFAIKIVMNSASTTKVPLIKDLRVIALAWVNINLLEIMFLMQY